MRERESLFACVCVCVRVSFWLPHHWSVAAVIDGELLAAAAASVCRRPCTACSSCTWRSPQEMGKIRLNVNNNCGK